MRRDVYLNEYEEMSFKERFYIYRKNRMGRISLDKLNPGNPIDWSIRKVLQGLLNVVGIPFYFLLYFPVAISGARNLKTAYVNEKWKRATHHKNLLVLK